MAKHHLLKGEIGGDKLDCPKGSFYSLYFHKKGFYWYSESEKWQIEIFVLERYKAYKWTGKVEDWARFQLAAKHSRNICNAAKNKFIIKTQ